MGADGHSAGSYRRETLTDGVDADVVDPTGSETAAPSCAPGDTEHHAPGGGFRNPWESFTLHGLRDVVTAFTRDFDRGRAQPLDMPQQHPDAATLRAGAELRRVEDGIQACWVGHATFLLQMLGFNILTDPIWSARCSPTQCVGPKRFVDAALP